MKHILLLENQNRPIKLLSDKVKCSPVIAEQVYIMFDCNYDEALT